MTQQKITRIHNSIRRCRKCRLCRSRTHAVPGQGPVPADVVLIGEAPGREEDRLGRPFVGRSGEFLNRLLEAVGLSRNALFITSSVKCRPPQNRAPRQDELKICKTNWLDRQIALINPEIVVLLGRVAMKLVLAKKENLTRIHGKVYKRDGRTFLVTFHPAAGLRFPKIAEYLKRDFLKLKSLLA